MLIIFLFYEVILSFSDQKWKTCVTEQLKNNET